VHQWLLSRLLIMVITFFVTLAGLSVIGVPFAGGLAVLSALVVFVPYVGPYISGGASTLVALLDGPETAAYTVLFYMAVENLQGWTVEPLIESRLTSAPPGVLLSAQVVLGLLLGAAGVLLASPLAVATMVLVQMVYVQDALGDDLPALGERRRRRSG
jgi:predicted PurR-regulated permease PerM